jgi:hypothetical protein
MHFRSSGNLCYLCHFFTLQPISRCQLSTALFCHPGLPELLVDAQERLSAPPEKVKLLTWPFTSARNCPKCGNYWAVTIAESNGSGYQPVQGAAPPATTKSLGRSSRRNPSEMPKAQTAKSARRAATIRFAEGNVHAARSAATRRQRLTLCVQPKWNHVASSCELLARLRCVLFS